MKPTKEQIETAYEPFGDEWEATMLQLPKRALVELFRKLALDHQAEHERAEQLEKELCESRKAAKMAIAAMDELMTEFVSKKRAANWGIINEACMACQSQAADLADAPKEEPK